MQVGIVGLSLSGKTTFFQVMTGSKNVSQGKSSQAIVKIPDNRVDYLSSVFNPRKTTYASLEAIDIPGLIPGGQKTSSGFLQAVRDSDLLVHVIRAFENPEVPYLDAELNPMGDLEHLSYELLLADLDQIEKRIERMHSGKAKKQNEQELGLLERLKDALEHEKPLSTVSMSDEEEILTRNYQFLTAKPCIVVVNIDEKNLETMDYPRRKELEEYCRERGIPVQVLSARIEQELSELQGDDRALFLEELGIKEPGLQVLTRLVYERLGLISFFTVGEDEVKAWTIEKGTPARKAAGKIHSDIERGFIRAEVISYESFCAAGSMNNAKNEGTLRLEGKEYVVQDGEIVHFRFNI
ncbi:MAG: redox-regulated ATPase YchF [Chitinophagales bacterium]